nr:hypothetical protein [Planotetraspora phitsanulokensis]
MSDHLLVGQPFERPVQRTQKQVHPNVINGPTISRTLAGACQLIDSLAPGRRPVHGEVQARHRRGSVLLTDSDHPATPYCLPVALLRPLRIDRQHEPLNLLDQLSDRPSRRLRQ